MTRDCAFRAGLLSITALCGCQTFGHTESGALVGSGLGAMTGAVIGGSSGHAPGGALIGAATGAVAGGLIGNAADAREERDAAIAHAQVSQAQAAAAQRALSNGDVISMTQNGVSDDVIIGSVRSNGCRFNGDPESIIQLKQAGVSDRVIQAMQTAPHVAAPGPPLPPPVVYGPPVYGPPPPMMIVTPRPYPPRYWGPRGYWRPRGYYW